MAPIPRPWLLAAALVLAAGGAVRGQDAAVPPGPAVTTRAGTVGGSFEGQSDLALRALAEGTLEELLGWWEEEARDTGDPAGVFRALRVRFHPELEVAQEVAAALREEGGRVGALAGAAEAHRFLDSLTLEDAVGAPGDADPRARANRQHAAAGLCARVLARFPDLVAARIAAARVAARARDPDAVWRHLREAAALPDLDAAALARIADLTARLAAAPAGGTSVRDQVIAAYRRALEVDRGWTTARRVRVEADLAEELVVDRRRRRRGTPAEREEGIRRMRSLLRDRPDAWGVRLALVSALARDGRLEEAAAAAADAPDDAGLGYVRGRLASVAGVRAGEADVRQEGDAVVVRAPVALLGEAPLWLTGDLDRWQDGGPRLTRAGDAWEARIRPPPGRHRYGVARPGDRRAFPLRAPDVCGEEPCFEIDAAGRLVAEARNPLALHLRRVRGLMDDHGFAVGVEEVVRALELAPDSSDALVALVDLHVALGLEGEVLETFEARAPPAARHDAARAWLREAIEARVAERAFVLPAAAAELRGAAVALARARAARDPAEILRGVEDALAAGAAAADVERVLREVVRLRGGREVLAERAAREGAHPLLDGVLADALLRAADVPGARVAAGRRRDRRAADGARAWYDHLLFEERVAATIGDRSGVEAAAREAVRRFPGALDLHLWMIDNKDLLRDPGAFLGLLGGDDLAGRPAGVLVRGVLREVAGEGGAEEDLLAAVQVAPHWSEPRHRLGCLLLRKGESRAAIGPLREAVDRGGGDAHVHGQLADALAAAGEPAAAFDEYERCFDLVEVPLLRGRVALTMAGIASSQLKDPARAVPWARTAFELLRDEPEADEWSRCVAAFLLASNGAHVRDQEASRQGLAWLQARPFFQLGFTLSCLLPVGAAALALLFSMVLLRRWPLLVSIVTAPFLWLMIVVLQCVGSGVAGSLIFDQMLAPFVDPLGPAGAVCTLIGYGAAAVPMALFAGLEMRRRGWTAREVGLHRWPNAGDLAWGIGVWVLIALGTFTVGLLLTLVLPGGVDPFLDSDNVGPGPVGAMGLSGGLSGVLLSIAVLAPLAEELFFRGYVYGVWREGMGRLPAALLSAGFFALAHLQAVAPLFFAGLAFTWIYERRGSLWAPIAAHFFMNLIAMTARYVASAG